MATLCDGDWDEQFDDHGDWERREADERKRLRQIAAAVEARFAALLDTFLAEPATQAVAEWRDFSAAKRERAIALFREDALEFLRDHVIDGDI